MIKDFTCSTVKFCTNVDKNKNEYDESIRESIQRADLYDLIIGYSQCSIHQISLYSYTNVRERHLRLSRGMSQCSLADSASCKNAG